MGGEVLTQGFGPVEDQRVAQADFPADMQQLMQAFGARQIAPCGFPGVQQLVGVHHKGLAFGGEFCAGAVAGKQGDAEQAFELVYPCGHGRLGNVQLFGRAHQAAVADNFKESTGQVEVHKRASVQGACSVRVMAGKHMKRDVYWHASMFVFRSRLRSSALVPGASD